MSDELYVMASMASFDAVHTDGVPVGCVTRLTSIEVVHRKRCITRYFIQTLTIRNRLLYRVLIVEDLVTAHDRLYTARQAQPAETIIEDLIKFQRSGGIVSYFHTGRQSVKDPIPPQDRMTLCRYQHARLCVPEDIILLQNTFATVKDTYTTITTVKDLISFECWIRVSFYPNTGHCIIKDLILFQQAQTTVIHKYTAILSTPDLVTAYDRVTARTNLYARVQMVEYIIVLQLTVSVIVEIHTDLFTGMYTIPA